MYAIPHSRGKTYFSKAIPLEYSLLVWGAISEKACNSVDKKHRPCSCGIRRRWFLHKWINIKQYPILPSAIDRLFKQIRLDEVNIGRLDKNPGRRKHYFVLWECKNLALRELIDKWNRIDRSVLAALLVLSHPCSTWMNELLSYMKCIEVH